MDIKKILGYKLFRFVDDSDEAEVVRVIRTYHDKRIMVEDKNGNKRKTELSEFTGWRQLVPDGIITASIVDVHGNKDVVVTMTRMVDIAVTNIPLVICRQSITDFFYTYLSNEENHNQVGISVTQETCPANINFAATLACDGIDFFQVAHIYINDTAEDILKLFNLPKFDEVLSKLFAEHVKSTNNPALMLKRWDSGWCKTLNDLLYTNNFWVDVDQMFNISDVDFNLEDYLEENVDPAGKKYLQLNDEAREFFTHTYKINISNTIVIEFDHDVDLGEFANVNYMKIRSKNGKLHIMTYYVNGEFIESDIEVLNMQKHISDNLRMYIFDKFK